jgi:hypothetical protein
MIGFLIQQARVCLTLFIQSLPPLCFFNVIRLGSQFVALFPESVEYNTTMATLALALAKSLQADLGGTDIYKPLSHV